MVGLEEEEPGSKGSPLLGSSFMARVIRYGLDGGEVRFPRKSPPSEDDMVVLLLRGAKAARKLGEPVSALSADRAARVWRR
ncbi:hypothetical protein MTO96_000109 [Rhipicephalus appendiculatus]